MAHAQPAVTGVSPGAVVPGTTVELTLRGSQLDEPLAIWTSFPATISLRPPTAETSGGTERRLAVTLAKDVPLGVGGIVVANAEGIADPVLLMVDDLPSVAEAGGNQSAARPQPVTPPVAVDGVGDGSSFDSYAFHGRAGARIAIEVYAARLGQEFDPVVRLLDAAGRELAWADDDAALGADCRLAVTLPATGPYVVELHDTEFRAGGRYRLRIGDFPVGFTAYPLGVQAGTTGSVAAAGADVAGVAVRSLAVAGDRVGEPLTVDMRYDGGVAAALTTIVAGRGPETVEAEPNDAPAQATSVSVPGAANGRFDAAKDGDCFRFAAQAGQRLAFRAYSRSLGSPALVKMAVRTADGKTLAESKVTEADEETLVVAIPADGSYVLTAHDLLKRGGDDMTYRIAIDAAPPFSLSLKPSTKGFASMPVPMRPCRAVAENGALVVDVRLARNGYDGPVTLSVEGPGGPYRVFHNVIGEKKSAARMIVLPPVGSRWGQISLARVRGAATVDGQPFAAVASSIDLLRYNRPMLVQPPASLDGLIPLTVVAPEPPLFFVTLDTASVDMPIGEPQAEFKVLLERKADAFDEPLDVTFPNPPPGLSFEVHREGDGPNVLGKRQTKETYRVVAKAAKGTPAGTHRVQVLGYGEVGGRGFAMLCGDLTVRVVQPLTVTVRPADAIAFGPRQKLRIGITRASLGGVVDRQPVVVRWKNLPAGLTAPSEVTIPADQDSAVVELVAGPDTATGVFADLAVTATTTVQGKETSAESTGLGGEVVK
ncbi:MAG: hypothetical protein ACKOES_00765 [Planctomycetaceae bacterium]